MNSADQNAAREQIVALHALYGQWQSHSIQAANDARSARLAWASEAVGRSIQSFSKLSRDEARELIDKLKGSMGQALIEQPRPWRHIRSRDRAQAAGTAGRRGGHSSLIQLASPDDIARIDQAVQRLGWTRERYEAWLKSASSPISNKVECTIQTVSEANKVWWALKAMLRRSGHWHPARRASKPSKSSAARKGAA